MIPKEGWPLERNLAENFNSRHAYLGVGIMGWISEKTCLGLHWEPLLDDKFSISGGVYG